NIYIQGYTEETIEGISYVIYDTGINMLALSNSIIIIGLIGNIVDTSIAISSALYEVHINNPKLSKKELFISGMNIGKDILGTTTNTLFFAYLGSYMTLFIYFQDFKYSANAIINSKVFAAEFTRIMLSGIASFIIIPLTSAISSFAYITFKEDSYEKNEYNIRRQGDSSSRQRTSSSNNSNRKKRIKNSI
ncbi:MAG: YibE/F family protein, partial [Bacilli bacterium]|nr:YibE/F family protein [Bacilli bacterium]